MSNINHFKNNNNNNNKKDFDFDDLNEHVVMELKGEAFVRATTFDGGEFVINPDALKHMSKNQEEELLQFFDALSKMEIEDEEEEDNEESKNEFLRDISHYLS